MEKRAATGVLLVHGIGEQPRRNTLTLFGHPLIDWLSLYVQDTRRQVFGGLVARSGEVRVSHPGFNNHPDDAARPESVIVDIVLQANAEVPFQAATERWLLAETWWADVFEKPRFSVLARWIFLVGPWVALSHVASRDRIEKRHLLYTLGRLLLALFFAFVVQIITLALSLLAIIPIPRLRRALSGLLSTLTATLGDAYVLVSNPIQKAAAIRKVLDGIDWLSARCDKVVVVAHSQGAAIAAEAVCECDYGKVDKLITFGSGLTKLQLLAEMYLQEQIHGSAPHKSGTSQTGIGFASLVNLTRYTTPLFFLLLIFSPKLVPLLPGVDLATEFAWIAAWLPAGLILFLNWVPAGVFVIYLALFGFVIIFDALQPNDRLEDRIVAIYRGLSPTRWVNIYAARDPVSNGPLELDDNHRFEQIEVRNLDSMLGDHTGYWNNRDEFVTNVIREIDRSGSGQVTRISQNDAGNRRILQRIHDARRQRIFCLNLHRWLILPTLLVIGWNTWSELNQLGGALLALVNDTSEMQWVGSALNLVGIGLGNVLAFFGLVETPSLNLGATATGLFLLALAGYLWHLLFIYFWTEFDEHQGRVSVIASAASEHGEKADPRDLRTLLGNRYNSLQWIRGLALAPAAMAVVFLLTPNPSATWAAVLHMGLVVLYILGLLLAILGTVTIGFLIDHQLKKLRKGGR